MRATRRRFACAAGLIAALVEVAAAQVLAQGVAPDAPGNLASVPEATLFVGGVTTSVPLEVPQGRNGIMPHLALAYTGGGPSLYGHGWDLPIGTIQRRLKYGVPTCEQASERYQYVLNLPGRTLEFKLNGTIGTPNVFEVPYKIVAKPSPAPWIWEVTDPSSGIRYVFGEGTARTGANLQSTDVNSCGENTIFSWALSSVIDPNGNKMSIIYVAGKSVHQPLRIEYGQGTGVNPLFYVDFNWQPRPMGEQIISAAAGFESVLADRLWKVVIGRIGGTFVRRYDFAYEDDYSENRFDRRTFLRSVIQYGRNASGSAVALARSDFQPAASTFQYANIPADPTRFGIADVQEPSVIPNLPGGIQLEITASVAATGESWSVRDLIDINGDGYLDIVDTFHLNNGQPGSTNSCTEWRVWRGNRDGFEADSVEWNVSNLPPVRRCYLNHVAIIHDNIQATEWGIADVTGDGLPDFIDASGEEWVIRTLPRTGDTTTRYFHAGSPYLRKIRYGVSNVEAPGLGLTAANGEGVSRDLIDMNGDGRLDFVDVRDETLGDGFKWNVWLNFDEGVKAAVPFKAHFKFISVVIAGTRLLSTLDVNGDGIPDQTYWKADGASGGWQVHLRTGRTTWRDVYWPANGLIDSRKLSSFNGARVAERIIQDVNGDGLPDIIDKGRCRVVANLGTGPVTAALNNGAGFTIVPWRFPASARCELGYSNLSADKMLSITDVDHDGLVDLLRKDAGSITVTRNAGGAWCAGGDCALPPERRTASAPYALLRSISALGSTTTLEYRPLSQWTNGSSRVPLSLWTVTRITTDDGLCERDIDGSILSCLTEGAHEIDRQYSYEGAFFSRSDREFRGFSKVTTHDTPSPAGQQFSVTYFHQGRHLKGRVASTDSYVAT
ncbi:MAG TPA: toxin TcdB middle/N-terminal domain-containing protein, partial [Terriglobales bacterium]|nr:toxin TcdB middle/N-terminal domain-containing protein [Terriglobales bacterium]